MSERGLWLAANVACVGMYAVGVHDSAVVLALNTFVIGLLLGANDGKLCA